MYTSCFTGEAWFTKPGDILEALLVDAKDCTIEVIVASSGKCIILAGHCDGRVAVIEEAGVARILQAETVKTNIRVYADEEACRRIRLRLMRGGG